MIVANASKRVRSSLAAMPASVSTDTADGGELARPSTSVMLLLIGDGVRTYRVPPDGELVLGRDPTCGVVLDHEAVSRHHAVVRCATSSDARPAATVTDLGSRNGIRVRGERLEHGVTALLKLGDSFQIGQYIALVLAGEPGAEDARGGPEPGLSTPDGAELAIADPTITSPSPTIVRLARSPVIVLILGETGSGKDVLARRVHELSGRTGGFVGINTAALSDNLLESELFGHERGAFTGANQAKPGLFETAPGGTVFLDEIGDLPLPLQAKLLRALETREIYRVGGVKPIPLDVRFVAATHHDLSAMVEAGTFRRDLYYRINGLTLRVLPLRERRDAIPQLAHELLAEVARAAGRSCPALDDSAIARLGRHAWPGNVRELRTVMERALLMAPGDRITTREILIDEQPDERARGLIAAAREHHGNVTAIARALGTSRSQVHRLAERFGVDLGRFRG